MKKLLAILLCLAMVLSMALLAGCGDSKKSDDDKEEASSISEENDGDDSSKEDDAKGDSVDVPEADELAGDWEADEYELTLNEDGTGSMTYTTYEQTLEIAWEMDGNEITFKMDESDEGTVGIYDGSTLDFSGDGGPVFSKK